MKKSILLTILVFFKIAGFKVFAQSSCSPVIAYNNSYNLCSGSGSLDITVNASLPFGCAYSSVTPFRLFYPNNTSLVFQSNTISVSNPQSGNYYVQIQVVQSTQPGAPLCPCIGSFNSNFITVNQTPSQPNITSDTIICGGSTILSADPPVGAGGGGYFNWYDNNNNLIFSGNSYSTNNLTTTTTFKVSYVLNQCESSLRQFNVVVNSLAQPVHNYNINPVVLNCNNNVTLSAVPSSNSTVYWYSNQSLTNLLHIGNQYTTPTLNQTTSYFIISKLNNCQSASEEIVVNIQPTPSPIVNETIGCQNTEIVLTASQGANALNNGFFEWYNNQNILVHSGIQYQLPKLITDSIGDFTYLVSNNINGCRSVLVPQIARIKPAPNLVLDTNFVKVCEGANFTLSVLSDFDPNVSYNWTSPVNENFSGNTISIENSDIALHEGVFTVQGVENLFNCLSKEKSVIVKVVVAPSLGLNDVYIMEDGSILELLVSGADRFNWQPIEFFNNNSLPNPTFTPPPLPSNTELDIEISVTGINLNNECNSTKTAIVRVLPFNNSNLIHVYDIITPNDDGYNDEWYIDYLYNLNDYEISVYDKNNNVIYYHNSKNGAYDSNRWKGKSPSNNPLPTGAYRYVIHSPNTQGFKTLRGQISILN